MNQEQENSKVFSSRRSALKAKCRSHLSDGPESVGLVFELKIVEVQ